MVEKPKPEGPPSNLAIIGRHILTPAVFDFLAKTSTGAGGELQLTDGMRMLLKREKMYAYVYEGRRYDTGDKLGFPEGHRRICSQAPGPGRRVPGVSKRP
jgi:UTP--glucose-1-phosphate uridylyltransferase